MEILAKTGTVTTAQLAPAKARTWRERRLMVLRRMRRLVAQALAAKTGVGDGYGTDVTDLSPEEYKARIRRQMMRG